MAGRVDRLQLDRADHEHVAVLQTQIRVRRGAVAMRDDRHAETLGDLVRRREVVRVRVRVDHVAQTDSVALQCAEIAVHLPDLGIDQRRDAGVRAADEIRLAAAGHYLLEDHLLLPVSQSLRDVAGAFVQHREQRGCLVEALLIFRVDVRVRHDAAAGPRIDRVAVLHERADRDVQR